jgi:hypothetical protein
MNIIDDKAVVFSTRSSPSTKSSSAMMAASMLLCTGGLTKRVS